MLHFISDVYEVRILKKKRPGIFEEASTADLIQRIIFADLLI